MYALFARIARLRVSYVITLKYLQLCATDEHIMSQHHKIICSTTLKKYIQAVITYRCDICDHIYDAI